MTNLLLEKLCFSYPSSLHPVIDQLTISFAPGWTAIMGSNGRGKTTLLKLLAGDLEPDSGKLTPQLTIHYCPQDCEAAPPSLREFTSGFDSLAISLREKLGIADSWSERWHQLSYGERKRLQVACALYERPAVLLLDEPSNHLDASSRQVLIGMLATYRGIGLLVSHDRSLLDALAERCLFLDAQPVTLLSGNYTRAQAALNLQIASEAARKDELLQAADALAREAAAQRHITAQSKKRLSKRNLDHHDHSGKGRLDAARLTGKDARSGNKQRALQSRQSRLEEQAAGLHKVKQYSSGLSFAAIECRLKHPINLAAGVWTAANSGLQISFPPLCVGFGQHVAMIGDNGSGKSTWLALLYEELKANAAHTLYIPQEVPASTLASLRLFVKDLGRQERGFLLTLVSRLGSRPERILQSPAWSPGEIRKLLIAKAVCEGAQLLLLDEPTNHMDLASIECLEQALSELACSLVMVSHDEAFIKATCQEVWRLRRTGPLSTVLEAALAGTHEFV